MDAVTPDVARHRTHLQVTEAPHYAEIEKQIDAAVESGQQPLILLVHRVIGLADDLGDYLETRGYRTAVTCISRRFDQLRRDCSLHAVIYERFQPPAAAEMNALDEPIVASKASDALPRKSTRRWVATLMLWFLLFTITLTMFWLETGSMLTGVKMASIAATIKWFVVLGHAAWFGD